MSFYFLAPTHEVFLKYSSLVVLTVQTTSLVLLIRYERVREQKDHFMSTTCVFLTEIVKLIVCLLLVIIEEKGVFT